MDTTITAGPSGTVTSNTATFQFNSPVADATFECRLDGGPWGPCTSPKNYSGLSNGNHTFEVRAKKGPGNTDDTPASRTWTVSAPTPQCSDGIDNGPRPDGKIDHPADQHCSSASDNSENQRPTAVADSYTTQKNKDLKIGDPGKPKVLDNDTDPDNDPRSVVTTGALTYTQPKDSGGTQRGTLTLAADGKGTYKPQNNFVGTVTFTYTVSDSKGGTDTTAVTIQVTN